MTFPYVERFIAVSANNNPPAISIAASINCRRMVIEESPDPSSVANYANWAPQGLIYTSLFDNFSAKHATIPTEPIILSNPVAEGQGQSSWVGTKGWTDPAGNTVAATTLVKLLSATNTATNVRVREWA